MVSRHTQAARTRVSAMLAALLFSSVAMVRCAGIATEIVLIEDGGIDSERAWRALQYEGALVDRVVGSFAELMNATLEAPTNGTEWVVEVRSDLYWNESDEPLYSDPNGDAILHIKDGQRVRIFASGDTLKLLIASTESEMKGGIYGFGNAKIRRHVYVSGSAELTLRNLEMRGGSVDTGGAIRIDAGGTLVATRCVFRDNTANNGFAAYIQGGTFMANECNFTENNALALEFTVMGQESVGLGTVYVGGVGEDDGGILGTFMAKNCFFNRNDASGQSRNVGKGGAVYIESGGVCTATECAFRKNRAGYGGAVFVEDKGVYIAKQCIFATNTAFPTRSGEDIYNNVGGRVALRSCDFTSSFTEENPRVFGTVESYCEPGVNETGCESINQVCSPKRNSGIDFGVECLAACPLGEHGGGATCTPCPKGKYGAFRGASEEFGCSPCLEGKFTNETGATQCTSCGNFDKDGERKWSGLGGAVCLFACSRGERIDSLSTSSCTACEPGKFNLQRGGFLRGDDKNACKLCDAGYYCEGGDSRMPCPAGRYREIPGGVVPSDCSPCPIGTFSKAIGLSSEKDCTQCFPGKVGVKAAATIIDEGCQACAPGKIAALGAFECSPCGTGTWQNGTDCVACPAGRFGNQTGLSNERCNGDCPPGKHSYRYASRCQDCEAGKHAPNASMEDCIACNDVDGLTPSIDSRSCLCQIGRYRDAGGRCALCLEGMECLEAGVEIATVHVLKGNWRPSPESDQIVPCPFKSSCPGGVNASCLAGNEGVLCAVCSAAHYRASAFASCTHCNNSTVQTVLSALAIVASMIIGLFALIAINRRAPTGILRPVIDVVQRFSVMMLFNAPFPKQLVSLGRALSALSFSLDLVAPECVGIGADFYGMFATTVGALVALCGVMLIPLLRMVMTSGSTVSETLKSKAAGVIFRDIFVIVLMVHPSVSGKAMQFFRCREIEGTSYLMADYSLECFDAMWWSFLPFVVFVLLAFSLGVPFAILYVLSKRSAHLYDAHGNAAIPSLDVLYAVYREGAYWYESVQMLFKLALWSTLVFFEFNSEMQLAIALVVNVLQLCVYIAVKPMGGPDAALLNAMQAAGLVLTTYINFAGFSMNYLSVAKPVENAKFKDQLETVDGYEKTISAIQYIMLFLTFGLIVTIVSVGLKNVYLFLRTTSLDEVRASVAKRFAPLAASFTRAFRCCRGGDGDAVAVVITPNNAQGQPHTAVQPLVKIQMVTQGPSSPSHIVACCAVLENAARTVPAWCFVGKRRLETAVRRLAQSRPDVDVNVRWHPFFLDPSLPASVVKADHYKRKFGADRTAAMIPRMQAVGLREAPPIRFSYGGALGNTLDSHRLIEHAFETGGAAMQSALIESLFSRYFEREQNPADHEVLIAAAVESGVGDAAAVKSFLSSDAKKDAVVQIVDSKRRQYRVQGVPHFVIGQDRVRGGYSFSGAQEADTILEVFEEILGDQ